MKPMRLRITTDIVTEFLPPRSGSSDRAIIVCDGLPSVPSKRHVLEYWSKRGFWVFHPRYKGTWESSGKFLDHEPTEDILEVARILKNGIAMPVLKHAVDQSTHLKIGHVTVIGASFGGAVALLASLHPEVDKVIAVSPVIDWKAELENTAESMADHKNFIRVGFGEAYRFSDSDFDRLGNDPLFFNPIAHIAEYNPEKICIMHAKDDMIVSYEAVKQFLDVVHCAHHIVSRGGHFSVRVSTHFFLGRRIRRFILG